MDALEFLQERQRMCDTYYNSEDEKCSASCPATGIQCVDMRCIHENGHEKELIAKVEAWAKEHPRETRQSLFIQQHPKVATYNGVIGIRPCQLEEGYTSPYCLWDESKCVQCRKEYWLQEVK